MMTTLHNFAIRYRERAAHKELMRLDSRFLRDVGLTRVEIPALAAETPGRFDNCMLSDVGFVRDDFIRAANKDCDLPCNRRAGKYVVAA